MRVGKIASITDLPHECFFCLLLFTTNPLYKQVFVYPALAATTYGAFLVFVDSYQWMWLRLVSFDVWMFGVLVPASFFWLPTANSE